MRYTYTARNRDGEVYNGETQAKDKLELYSRVKAEGGEVISAKEKKERKLVWSGALGGVATRDKIVLAKNLSSMLSAGLSLPRALGVMERETKKLSLKNLLKDLEASVTRGEAFSEALKRHPETFSQLFSSMVRAGEESGDLSGSLKVISSEMEKSYLLTRKVRSAMIYPAVVLTLMIVIAILLLIYMVPSLTTTFAGLNVELPLSTRVIIATSGFLVSHTLPVIGSILVLVLAGLIFWRSSPGKRFIDAAMIHIPVLGELVKEIQSARTARTLSSLLSAGVPVVTALEVTEEVLPNHIYRAILSEGRSSIQKGEPLSSVFKRREKFYPPFVAEMTAVGEETGRLSEMLANVATYYEDEVDEKTKDLSAVIEPFLMIIVGGAVAIFAVSMLAPTYSLVDTL